MKVGADLDADDRRAGADPPGARPGRRADDGRQPGLGRRRGDRRDAACCAVHDPWWIEEPTSPDDVLGHARIRREVAPIRVATGEHVQNRVIFKQLFQARAIDVCQIDACRIGGVNEAIAVLLLAAKFGVPVCPHAGGVGLCEYVQHLAFFDYIAVSGSLDDRVVEWVDHLHEHFRDPAVVERRPLPRAAGARLQHRDAALVARRVRVPERPGVGAGRGRGGRRMTVAPRSEQRRTRSRRAPALRPLPPAPGGAARRCAPARR